MTRTAVIVWLCLLASAGTAAAEWQISPMIGLTLRGNTSLADLENATHLSHKEIGGAVTFLTRGLFGAEGVFSWTPGFFHSDHPTDPEGNPINVALVNGNYTLALMGNVVVAAPRRRLTEYGFRPLASGGFGLLRAVPGDIAGLVPGRNVLGFNVGGGVVGFITARTGLRLDLRYYSNVHRSEQVGDTIGRLHLRYLVASVGISFRTSRVQ